MLVPEDVAKLFGTESDAGNSPLGMESKKAISSTSESTDSEDPTISELPSGDAIHAISDVIIPVHNLRLSEEQATFLSRMKRTRHQGYMLSMEDCDILIRIVEELSRP